MIRVLLLSPVGAFLDITELKRAEEELRESEARYRALVELAPDAVLVYQDARIVYANAVALRLYGAETFEELRGKNILDLVHPADREIGRARLQRLQRGERAPLRELRHLHLDGHEMSVEATAAPTGWHGKHAVQVIIRDITERKRMEDALRQSRDELGIKVEQRTQEISRLNTELEQRVKQRTAQLQAANEELESFSYSISHDLRSPLLAIDGFSKILEKRYWEQLDEEGRRILSVICQSTSRMGRLIDDLLSFSRWGRQEMRIASINMTSLAKEVFSSLSPDPKVFFSLDPLPSLRADPAMMRQVLENLLSNALKFSASQDRPAIEVGSASTPTENTYFIRDNGVGFDPSYAGKLFSVFSRLHRSDEFAGTGVGLAIVKRIIQGHGGRVWAEGQVGQGATFYFSLPRAS